MVVTRKKKTRKKSITNKPRILAFVFGYQFVKPINTSVLAHIRRCPILVDRFKKKPSDFLEVFGDNFTIVGSKYNKFFGYF